MNTVNIENHDELREEYDLPQLRLKKIGPARKSGGDAMWVIVWNCDVCDVYDVCEENEKRR